MQKASIIRVEEMINESTAKIKKQMLQMDNLVVNVNQEVSKINPKFE